VNIERLWLTDFRNYESVEIELSSGVTVVHGANGQGKSNLLEALSLLMTKKSFRGANTESVIRLGAEAAVIRAEAKAADGRELLIEMEIPRAGRLRMQVNRNSVTRRKQLAELFALVVFSPDDLILIKGGPGERRDWLDDLVAQAGAKQGAAIEEFEGVLKQRNALLRNAEGYLSKSAAETLDVIDEQLASAGSELVSERTKLINELSPYIVKAYEAVAEAAAGISIEYQASFEGELLSSLTSAREADVRRGTSTVGPHRDEISFSINDMSARLYGSQGEQRSLVLALRLAAHQWLTETRKDAPLLLLDDVFSELDEFRRRALVAHLPESQTVLTTASDIPSDIHAAAQYEVKNGEISRVY